MELQREVDPEREVFHPLVDSPNENQSNDYNQASREVRRGSQGQLACGMLFFKEISSSIRICLCKLICPMTHTIPTQEKGVESHFDTFWPCFIFIFHNTFIHLHLWGIRCPGPLKTPESMDAQVPYIKWCDICIESSHTLPTTLNHL